MSTDNYAQDKFTIDRLIRRSWNLRDSRDFTKFLSFIAKFHHYSRFNAMLIYLQNEEVTFFGSESYWKKKFNRTIRKDARPYIILAPMSPVLLAYDVMETEGRDSPKEFLDRLYGEKIFEVRGRLRNPTIFDGALFIAKSWGIPTKFKHLSYFKEGYVTTAVTGRLEICLKEGVTVEENFKVMLHELAHILLGHTGFEYLRRDYPEKKMALPKRDKLSRSAEEIEAETVSYLISTKLGLIPNSENYIAGYIKNIDDLLTFSYETVIKVADKIENMFLKPLSNVTAAKQISLF